MIDDIDDETLARWRERGGIIRIGLDDKDRLVGFIPIDRLLEITDPISEPPWHDGPDVSREGVLSAISDGRFEQRPYSCDLLSVCRREWNSRRHEERIAWLVLNPPADPIEIEIDQYCGVGIDDGMHRLFAAVVREDRAAFIQLGGYVDYASETIGVVCDIENAPPSVRGEHASSMNRPS